MTKSTLVNHIKNLAYNVTESIIIPEFTFGKVINLKPFRISILDTEEELSEEFFVLGYNLKRKIFRLNVSHQHKTLEQIEGELVPIGETDEALTDIIEIELNRGLRQDDTVVLLKQKGGQRFYIMDVIAYDLEEEIYE